MEVQNKTILEEKSDDVVYWAMNGYGVTLLDLVIGISTVLLALAIMFLNALVLDTMVRLKKNFEPADVLVCSLAIADFLSGMLLVYNTAYNLINYQEYLECLLRSGSVLGLLSTSVLHLAFLTVDRYVKIIVPYRYEQLFTINSMVIVSVVVWVVSVTIAFTPAMGWNVNIANATTDLVTAVDPGVANRHARIIAAQEAVPCSKDFRESHTWKYTKTVLILMGLYFICWLPSGTLIILFVNGNLQQYNVVELGVFLAYVGWVGFANSVVNPIVYAYKIRAVRERFRKTFSCLRCCCCRKIVGAQTTVFSIDSAAIDVHSRLTWVKSKLPEAVGGSGGSSEVQLLRVHSSRPSDAST
ncbi:G-protein coupled receptor 12-like [Plakobranchus ocellatus]|uniref:G-protein coupled receptor 12-like n=1 Tax=Plakobranchus ocellatus TaxID=259542 RepID=A0AAV4DQ12_9GAST|nr:G-protein coupled receptor 12-like [Plakobranchus ocellatus]